MNNADAAWRESLRPVSIADLAQSVTADYGPGTMSTIAAWLTAPTP